MKIWIQIFRESNRGKVKEAVKGLGGRIVKTVRDFGLVEHGGLEGGALEAIKTDFLKIQFSNGITPAKVLSHLKSKGLKFGENGVKDFSLLHEFFEPDLKPVPYLNPHDKNVAMVEPWSPEFREKASQNKRVVDAKLAQIRKFELFCSRCGTEKQWKLEHDPVLGNRLFSYCSRCSSSYSRDSVVYNPI